MNDKDRLFELFNRAVELPPFERETFLRRECGDNEGLRNELRELLANDPGPVSESLLSPVESTPADDAVFQSGERVGNYQLIRRLGVGGMGVVYLAEQREPVRRRVALKILRSNVQSADVVRRFEKEKQLLAALNHPAIAKVFDAGTANDGRPYFVMEYVDGEPLTKYADNMKLPVRDRLELFVLVCKALGYAHAKGIIHRDIKPANILVSLTDDVPQVKIIDFGIAKALDPQYGETLHTSAGMLMGTLEYMSPEQAQQERELTAAADVYSLGVMLFELLTGALPLDSERLREVGLEAALRLVREEDPEPPSTRVDRQGADATAAASGRAPSQTALRRVLRGDLDAIVMRSLEKSPHRRYSDSSELRADLERYLSGELIVARPVSSMYRFRRRIRKHWSIVAATAAAVAAVSLAATWPLLHNTPEFTDGVKGVAGLEDMEHPVTRDSTFTAIVAAFSGATPEARREGVAMQRLVTRTLLEAFASDPKLTLLSAEIKEIPRSRNEAMLLGRKWDADLVVWGDVVAIGGEVDFQPYVLTLDELAGPGALGFGRDFEDLAGRINLEVAGDNQLILRKSSAEEIRDVVLILLSTYFMSWYEDYERSFHVLSYCTTESPAVLTATAGVHSGRMEHEQAKQLLKKALDQDSLNVFTRNEYASMLYHTGEGDAATAQYKRAIEIDPSNPAPYSNLGLTAFWEKRFDEAIDWYQRAIGVAPRMAGFNLMLGLIYRQKGDVDLAIEEFQMAISKEPTYGNAHLLAGNAFYYGKRDVEAAVPYWQKAAEFGTPDDRGSALHNLGWIHQERGEKEKAITFYERAIEVKPQSFLTYLSLGHLRFAAGRFDEASKVYTKATDVEFYRYERANQEVLLAYFHVLRFLSRARIGDGVQAMYDLRRFENEMHDAEWTPTLVRYLTGSIGEADLLARAPHDDVEEQNGRFCEAYYLVGMAHLLGLETVGGESDTTAAIASFERSIATEMTEWNEFEYAQSELERIR